MGRGAFAVAAALATLLSVVAGAHAAKKDRTGDAIWTRPDYASLNLDRIAMLPVATFDHDYQTATLVEAVVGQAFKGAGYRWISAGTTRDLLRASAGGDSILKALEASLLQDPRVDSLSAPRLCSRLNCDALLAFRVDQWEQLTPEWNQAGKATTSVRLKAALVDSLGRLVWTATGGNTSEGGYYDPSAGMTGVKDSGLDRKPVSAQGGAPTFRETATTLLTRWIPRFPAKPLPAAPADSASAPKPQ